MRLDSNVVALTSCAGYEPHQLDDCIRLALGSLADLPSLHSCNVLLKPNLIAVKYGTLPCTEPAFMVAAARYFVDRGARVAIGDSPAFGTATSALKKLGVAGELVSMGVRIKNFTKVKNVVLPGGDKAGMAVAALDSDLLVNLPRVKAHGQTGVTLAVKNCFGCLVGLRKPLWHMAHGGKGGSFCNRLLQLLDVLPDSVALADGITAMHTTGPLHGKPYSLKVIAASTNPVALDRALLELLSVEPRQIPLMQACLQAGLEGSSFSRLIFPLASPDQLQVADFQVPDVLTPIRFDLLRFLRNMIHRSAQNWMRRN